MGKHRRKRTKLTSPTGVFIHRHCCDAQLVISRELVAVEDFRPGVPITSHEGSAASLDSFAQTAAGVDEPGKGMGIAAPLGSSWQQAEGFAAAQGCASGYQQLLQCVRGAPGVGEQENPQQGT